MHIYSFTFLWFIPNLNQIRFIYLYVSFDNHITIQDLFAINHRSSFVSLGLKIDNSLVIILRYSVTTTMPAFCVDLGSIHGSFLLTLMMSWARCTACSRKPYCPNLRYASKSSQTISFLSAIVVRLASALKSLRVCLRVAGYSNTFLAGVWSSYSSSGYFCRGTQASLVPMTTLVAAAAFGLHATT